MVRKLGTKAITDDAITADKIVAGAVVADIGGDVTINHNSGATTGVLNIGNANGNGTLAQINMGHSGDTDHGSISYTGNMSFKTGGNTTALTIDSSQRVGIGNTSPNRVLSLKHASQAEVGFKTGSVSNGALIYYNDSEGQLLLRAQEGSDSITFQTGGTTERMRINSSGKVGIGVSPTKTLDVKSTTNDDHANIKITYGGTDGYRSGVVVANTHTGGREYGLYAGNNSTGGGLGNSFGIMDNTASAYRLVINSDGNVGIGTTAPNPVGLGIVTTDGTKGVMLTRVASGGSNPSTGQGLGSFAWKGIMDGVNTTLASEARIVAIAAENHSGSTAATGLHFYTKPSGVGPGSSPTERMAIDSAGRVLKPGQPAFMAIGNNTNYITTSPVPFPSVQFNIGNHYNSSNYTFTAPVAGRYFFHAHMGLVNGGSGNQIYPWFSVNGSQQQYTYVNFSTTWYSNAHLTCVYNLAANDTVKITISVSGATYYNGGNETRFMGYLIG